MCKLPRCCNRSSSIDSETVSVLCPPYLPLPSGLTWRLRGRIPLLQTRLVLKFRRELVFSLYYTGEEPAYLVRHTCVAENRGILSVQHFQRDLRFEKPDSDKISQNPEKNDFGTDTVSQTDPRMHLKGRQYSC